MKRIVYITGATRGLGRAMTDKFIAEGFTVAGCGRSAQGIAELQQSFTAPHFFHVADMADDPSVALFVKEALEAVGPPDLLINNAALINRDAPLWELTAEEFGPLMDVNLKGVASMIRHCVPAMISAGHGVIVNFSSGWGRSTSPGVAPYCATKWGIEGMTGALAQELPKGLAAVALNPGVIYTEMLEVCFGTSASTYPSPEAWAAKAVPFLAQLDARSNGESLTAPQP